MKEDLCKTKCYGKDNRIQHKKMSDIAENNMTYDCMNRVGLIPGMMLDATMNDPGTNRAWNTRDNEEMNVLMRSIRGKAFTTIVCDPFLGIMSSARKAMGVRGDEKEKGAGKAGIVNKWVEYVGNKANKEDHKS